MSLDDAVWNYRNGSKPLLSFLREEQIPIAGIEPKEKESDRIEGGTIYIIKNLIKKTNHSSTSL